MVESFLLIDTYSENSYSKIKFIDNFPSELIIWNSDNLTLKDNATHFGFVHKNSIELIADKKKFTIYENMYFSINGSAEIIGSKESIGFIASRNDYHGFFNIGGPIEKKGRYKYIDGCSDSLLISPVSYGDPCFNLLYFPVNINQTPHTHPSVRIGMIVEGEGFCLLNKEKIELKKGQVFIINTDVLHSFKTEKSDMLIVVYHPESDFGPTDKNHPMINKTIIDGISASKI